MGRARKDSKDSEGRDKALSWLISLLIIGIGVTFSILGEVVWQGPQKMFLIIGIFIALGGIAAGLLAWFIVVDDNRERASEMIKRR